MNEYLAVLRQTPDFQLLLKAIKDERPIVPVYDHTEDNTEDWKAKSNIQRGFDLAMACLGEKYNGR